MATLPVDFLDDILNASMNGKRKYRITHADGSTEEVILEDVSEYDQVGSNFGAAQVNQTNEAVNEKLESADVVDPMVATEEGFAADAKLTGDALSELNKKCIVISEQASIAAVKGAYVDIAKLTLEAGHTYLLTGGAYCSVSDPTLVSNIHIHRTTGTGGVYGCNQARTTMSGGGGSSISIVAICKTNCEFTLRGYTGSSQAFDYIGGMSAILLQ